jgi:spore coat polysaccharide biosynthesis protein SpsF
MRISCIIRARISTTRLPGKVPLHLAEPEALANVFDRLAVCDTVDDFVVVTSEYPSDDLPSRWCDPRGVIAFRGNLEDVLDRYYHCAVQTCADAVVRSTADCPVLDPTSVDEVVRGFKAEDYDLFFFGGEFPDGPDCAVFSFWALEKASCEATLKFERKHVGPCLLNQPQWFSPGGVQKFKGLTHHRSTLGEPTDLAFLGWGSELLSSNQGIARNEGLKSRLRPMERLSD